MNGDEMRHIGEAQREIEQLLEQKSLKQSVRSGLQRALGSIEKALNWGEDELVGGSTDD